MSKTLKQEQQPYYHEFVEGNKRPYRCQICDETEWDHDDEDGYTEEQVISLLEECSARSVGGALQFLKLKGLIDKDISLPYNGVIESVHDFIDDDGDDE